MTKIILVSLVIFSTLRGTAFAQERGFGNGALPLNAKVSTVGHVMNAISSVVRKALN